MGDITVCLNTVDDIAVCVNTDGEYVDTGCDITVILILMVIWQYV